MVGAFLKVTITQYDKNGVATSTELGDLNKYEILAAIGTLAADCVELSEGQLDIENIVAAVRGCYYNRL